jgi:transposase
MNKGFIAADFHIPTTPDDGRMEFRMKDIELFQAALGLTPPWKVRECRLDLAKKRLDIFLDFPPGSEFTCPACEKEKGKAYDTEERTWRHLNFFQYEAHLTARLPRVECGGGCGVKTVKVPWARPGSGFTFLYEALVMILVKEMPVKPAARILGEHDTRIWRIVQYHVEEAWSRLDLSEVEQVGIDETSSRRGHNYISVFVDLEKSQVVFATEGKDGATVKKFVEDLKEHGGSAEKVAEVCIDMSPAFISGVTEYLPKAQITFDKFHTMKLINEAVNEVRVEEQKERDELKGSRYLFLRNRENLSSKQLGKLMFLEDRKLNLKTVRALRIRESFQDMFSRPPEEAEIYLRRWYFWATHSQLEPMKAAAKTVKKHWDGILRWFHSRVTNGVLEGINSLIQAAKAKARGYRTVKNLITAVYLVAGKLDFQCPLTHTK